QLVVQHVGGGALRTLNQHAAVISAEPLQTYRISDEDLRADSFAAPTPGTASTSSHERKPASPRASTSACASWGPTPGICASSSFVARLRSSFPPSASSCPAGNGRPGPQCATPCASR